jgi:hypothetical protein
MKLQCVENEYYLTDNGRTIATTDKELLNDMIGAKKLSKQNCDKIFGIVDVEKLADDSSQEFLIKPIESPIFTFGYEEGFEKAMELNKDKLFTVEDMRKVFNRGYDLPEYLEKDIMNEIFDDYIQSLQPTEIEVEIRCYIGNGDKESDSFKDPLVTNTGIPKLDENGCLILKKK